MYVSDEIVTKCNQYELLKRPCTVIVDRRFSLIVLPRLSNTVQGDGGKLGDLAESGKEMAEMLSHCIYIYSDDDAILF